jgi:hypothetical protein
MSDSNSKPHKIYFAYLLCVLWTAAAIAYRDQHGVCISLATVAIVHWLGVFFNVALTFMLKSERGDI